jgi:hypothetical protein
MAGIKPLGITMTMQFLQAHLRKTDSNWLSMQGLSEIR